MCWPRSRLSILAFEIGSTTIPEISVSSSTSTSMTQTSASGRVSTRRSASVMSSPSSQPLPAEVAEDPLDHLPASAVVAVAMSGGVDSSVVAARVAQRGVRAVGLTLAMWSSEREVVRDRGCCSIDAVEDARRVAGVLGITHYVWNLEAEVEAVGFRDFENEYAAGRTPNPCTRCNERVKFGVLLDRARGIGATHLATGHYARIGRRAALHTL